MKKISGVIMDWAGTAVDYGCFAPLNAFLKVFSEEKGIDITYRQAREPMRCTLVSRNICSHP